MFVALGITLFYIIFVWLIFFKFQWLPWNKVTRNASVAIGVIGLLAVVIGLVQGSPSASGGIQFVARVTSISAHSPGLVVEAPAESYMHLKKGDLIVSSVFGAGFTWGAGVFRL